MFYMRELDKYIQKLVTIKENDTTSIKLIASYFIENLEKDKLIVDASSIAIDIGISNALISKFVKKMKYQNIHEILFLQKLYKKEAKRKDRKEKVRPQIVKVARLIENQRKIFFIGVSNGFNVNMDFARKINRLDKWTYVSDNKYEQIGLSRLLTPKDLIIVTSISLQHQWMTNIILKTNAKVILISKNLPKKIKEKVDIFFKVISNNVDTIHRYVTFVSRLDALKTFDRIYAELISYQHNKKLMIFTRYNL